MKQKRLFKTLIIVGLSLVLNQSFASDTAKEKRWAEQVSDSIMVGDPEWLKVGKSKIFSIYTENNSSKTLGGAIILHGSGVHPNWDQIIRPMRSQLPDHGWSTLSVQLPVLPNEAGYKEYIPLFKEVSPRIDAAVKFLKSKGIKNIAIVSHSLGSSMAAYYLANKPAQGIRAFVAVGASGEMYKDDKVGYLNSIKKIKIPVLDIYGSNDLDGILQSKKAKLDTARKAGNKKYTQVMISGANHFFDNKDAELVKRVRGWLNINAK